MPTAKTIYKKTNIPWIGEIPEHWEVRRLKSLYNFSKGKGLSKLDIIDNGKNRCLLYGELFTRFKENNVIVDDFQTTNLDNGKKSDGNEMLMPGSTTTKSIDLCNCKTLKQPNILLGGDIIILKPKEDNTFNEYFSYFISSICKTEFVMYGKGVTIHHIYSDQIANMKVVYPPLSEQTAIAAYLDRQVEKINHFIKKKRHYIALLKENRQAIINQAVTQGINPNTALKNSGIEGLGKIPKHWEVRRLKYCVEIYNGATPSTSVKDYWGGEVIWTTPAEINNMVYIEYSERKLTLGGYKSCGVHLVPKYSIILTTRAPIGKIAIARKELCTNQGCKSLVPFDIYYKFLYFYLITKTDILNMLGQGTTFKELGNAQLSNLKIPLPKKQEQTAIVSYIQAKTVKIDCAIAKAQKEMELIQEYKEAMIAEAVLGKLNHKIVKP